MNREILLLKEMLQKAEIPFKCLDKSFWGYLCLHLNCQIGKSVFSIFQVEKEGLLELMESVETNDKDISVKVDFLPVHKVFEKLKSHWETEQKEKKDK